MDIKKEIENLRTTENENKGINERKFVEFSYSSQEAFLRFEAVKDANAIIADAIRRTGGHMTKELIEAYEAAERENVRTGSTRSFGK